MTSFAWTRFPTATGSIAVPSGSYLSYVLVPNNGGVPPSSTAALNTGTLVPGPYTQTVSTLLNGFYYRIFTAAELAADVPGGGGSLDGGTPVPGVVLPAGAAGTYGWLSYLHADMVALNQTVAKDSTMVNIRDLLASIFQTSLPGTLSLDYSTEGSWPWM